MKNELNMTQDEIDFVLSFMRRDCFREQFAKGEGLEANVTYMKSRLSTGGSSMPFRGKTYGVFFSNPYIELTMFDDSRSLIKKKMPWGKVEKLLSEVFENEALRNITSEE